MCLLKPLVWNWLVCRSLPEQQLLVNGRMEREARWPLIFKPVRFVREICNWHVQSLVDSDFQRWFAICHVWFSNFYGHICSVRVICYWHVIPDFQTSIYVIREICNLRVIKLYQTTSYIFTYVQYSYITMQSPKVTYDVQQRLCFLRYPHFSCIFHINY